MLKKPNRCVREWNGALLEIRSMHFVLFHRNEVWNRTTNADVVFNITLDYTNSVRAVVQGIITGTYISGKEL